MIEIAAVGTDKSLLRCLMAISRAVDSVNPSSISYLGPSAADCREGLSDDEGDIFIEDEWDKEQKSVPPSLFPLTSPCISTNRIQPLPPPPKFAADADNIDIFGWAEYYFDSHSYKNAIKCLDQIIAATPHHTPAFLLRGECHHVQRNFAEAIKDYSKVLEWGSWGECDDARLLLGDCLLSMGGHAQEALIHLERSVNATHSSDAYALRGRALAALGDIDGAKRDLAHAKQIAQTNTQPILTLEGDLKWLI